MSEREVKRRQYGVALYIYLYIKGNKDWKKKEQDQSSTGVLIIVSPLRFAEVNRRNIKIHMESYMREDTGTN